MSRLQDARKAIEMFRQVKVDIMGLVENMSYFVCPHCHHEIDIFSKGGGERTADSSVFRSWDRLNLIPRSARAETQAVRLRSRAKSSPHAKSIYAFARKVSERVKEIRASRRRM